LIAINEEGPLIACGNGQSVRLLRARSNRKLVDGGTWKRYFANRSGTPLLGRAIEVTPEP
jgi:hypothetical protein